MIVLLVILIITVVAINYTWKDNKTENNIVQNTSVEVNSNSTTNDDNTESKLENILSQISGVGKVKVMLTYSQSSTTLPIYNENIKLSNTTEDDGDGGTRTISEDNSQKEVIYKERSDGTKEPITQSILSPKIEGAVIAAQGADNDDVKVDIIQAIEAATGLATHKIQVFKMN